MSITPSVAVDTIQQSSMPISNGNTLYVGGTVVEKTTIMDSKSNGYIQNKIDNANDGDTVYIPHGYYHEYIRIDKSINLIGEDKHTTIIDGDDREYNIVYIKANWVNISGFAILNSGPLDVYYGAPCGIYIGGDNNTIKDNNILNNKYCGIQIYSHRSNNIITGNNFLNNYYGIELRDSNDNTITGNNFSNNDYTGIELYDSHNNIIIGNNFSNNLPGISLEDSSNNNIISDNSFFNDGLNIYDSYQNIVTNNTVNGKPLVYLEDESDITIDNAGQVILINCDKITIQNQDLSKAYEGIHLSGTHNCRIFGNIISNNRCGIWLDYSNKNIIQKNNFWGNRFNAIFLYSWRNRWKQNYWNRPRILPKLIFGFILNIIPWINIDWCPALLPYKIGV